MFGLHVVTGYLQYFCNNDGVRVARGRSVRSKVHNRAQILGKVELSGKGNPIRALELLDQTRVGGVGALGVGLVSISIILNLRELRSRKEAGYVVQLRNGPGKPTQWNSVALKLKV